MEMSEELKDCFEWLANGETGLSSEYMLFTILGVDCEYNYPRDTGDFGRCVGLLMDVPWLREGLPLVAETGLEWEILVKNWSELEGSYIRELQHVENGPMVETSLLMRDIMKGVDTWQF